MVEDSEQRKGSSGSFTKRSRSSSSFSQSQMRAWTQGRPVACAERIQLETRIWPAASYALKLGGCGEGVAQLVRRCGIEITIPGTSPDPDSQGHVQGRT